MLHSIHVLSIHTVYYRKTVFVTVLIFMTANRQQQYNIQDKCIQAPRQNVKYIKKINQRQMWWKLVDHEVNRRDAEGRGMEMGYTISINLQGDIQLCVILVAAMEKADIIIFVHVRKTFHDISNYFIFSPVFLFALKFLELMFNLKK